MAGKTIELPDLNLGVKGWALRWVRGMFVLLAYVFLRFVLRIDKTMNWDLYLDLVGIVTVIIAYLMLYTRPRKDKNRKRIDNAGRSPSSDF